MERFSSTSVRESFMGSKKPRGYNGNYYDTTGSSSGSSTPSRKNIKTVKLGDASKNPSPFKGSPSMSSSTTDQSSIWKKVKNGCYNMVHPKARKGSSATYSRSEFDNRVVMEIYKSMEMRKATISSSATPTF
ncbi:hypothetical protein POM88_039189 [Heracleum sosnowskyi]|uniref:Uncharacterized protein n=1 Tax=Heracleum sosnowskyi TaxID=360622 RepID=A0AAD8HCA5_9APIA|nr:hypothetical protein POM88_039189 [Heracleum sosnowskyi]